MKKIILVLATMLLLTGCGASDEEKEKMLYDSLEKAYMAIYTTDGVGLAVHGEETISIDEKLWYKVAMSDYQSLEKLTNLADTVFTEDVAKKINKDIKNKYREVDNELYTISEGGCILPFQDNIDTTLKDDIKKAVKIKKISMNKITFEYDKKEYVAEKDDDHYVFDKKMFKCIED
jgi:hypothetical protein